MVRSFGSGQGNSFDSDFLKCRRYFYWLHREGVAPRAKGDGAAIIVGHAGHAWMEAFYSALTAGTVPDAGLCADFADGVYQHELEKACGAAKELGFEIITIEKKSQTALQLLHVLAPKFARRVAEGERTVASELHGTLTLPQGGVGLPTGYIRNDLRNFTVAIDRAFYHPGDEEQPLAGLAIDEYKFTGMQSPAAYAEQQLLNDQSLGYLYWLQAAHSGHQLLEELNHNVIGVRYRVFRVDGSITPKSYAEVWETVSPQKLQDWYVRKCALRAEMSRMWDAPMDEWTAARYAFGPCHSWGRECQYLQMCDEPGEERKKVGSVEDEGSPYVLLSETEFEKEKA